MSAIFISHSSHDNTTAGEVKARMLEQGHRAVFLDFDPQNGIPAGRDWEKELYLRLRSCQAVVVLCSEHSLASQWCFAEITQARALGKHLFPLKTAPCQISPLLSDLQVTDLTVNPAAGYQQLWSGLKHVGLDPMDLFDWDGSRPPYPGLLAYQESDAAVYFGRHDAIQATMETLNRLQRLGGARLVLVLGASGSGKSSLVRAGVVPRLKRDQGRWLVLEPFRPLGRPFDELAIVLANAFASCGAPRDWKGIREVLRAAGETSDDASLVDLGTDLRVAAGRREATILLVIDQFEELLGRSVDPSAGSFLRCVSAAVNQAGSPFLAIATLRSDFLGEFQGHEAVHNLPYEPLPLAPVALADFAQVIEGPARVTGAELEPGLVQAMVADAATDDALPLLAFALRELWDWCSPDRRLTLDAYRQRLGGLQGALARAAEAICTTPPLGPDQEHQLRTALLAMVRVDEDGRYVRRPALWQELPDPAHDLVERFVQARLLVSRSDDGERIVEVAHEALFRSWGRLGRWLAADQEFLLWRQRLRGDVAKWERAARDESLLLRGPVLVEAERWLAERGGDMNAAEREFVAASVSVRDREVEARERARRRRRMVAAAVIAVVSVTAGLALLQWWRAEEQRAVAEARGLAAQADLAYREDSTSLERSALLGIESTSRVPLPESDRVLRQALLLLPKPIAVFRFEYPVLSAAFSPDGRYVAAAGVSANDKGTVVTGRYVSVFDVMTRQAIAAVELDSNDGGGTVAFSPNGEYVITENRIFERTGKEVTHLNHDGRRATASIDSSGRYLWLRPVDAADDSQQRVLVFDAMTGREVAQLAPSDATGVAAFSGDGRYRLMTSPGAGGERVRVVDQRSGHVIEVGSAGGRAAIGPDGKYAVVAGATDSNARVYEVGSNKEIARLRRAGVPHELVFSPDGDYIAASFDDGTAGVFATTTGREVTRVTHAGQVSTLRFSADGRYLVTGSMDRTVRIFETVRSDAFQLRHSGSTNGAAFSADGRHVMSLGGDAADGGAASARVFEVGTGREVSRLDDKAALVVLAFSQDARYVAMANSDDNAVRILDVATGNEAGRLGDDNDGAVSKAAFSPDARHLATWAGLGSYARVFDVQARKEIAVLEHGPAVSALAFSPDGRYIVLASESLEDSPLVQVSVFDAGSGKAVVSLEHVAGVDALAFSDNGRYVVTGGRDGAALIFEVSTGREVSRMSHSLAVQVVAFGPDDRYVATATDDGTVRVFEAMAGKEIAQVIGDEAVRAVTFSRDVKYFHTVSGDRDLMVRRHLLSPKDLIDETCARLTRNLTLEERNRYLGGAPQAAACSVQLVE